MANLLEQYEQAAQRAASLSVPFQSIRPELSTTGYINARLEEEVPIFTKQKVDLTPPDPVTHLVVCNEQLALIMVHKVLLRIDMHHPDKPDEIDIMKSINVDKTNSCRIHQIFLDPNGQHLLFSLLMKDSINTYYLSRNSRKLRICYKMKGHVVSAVAWNPYNSKEGTTGSILIGTTKGLIFETELAADDRNLFQSNIEQHWKQVFDIGRSNSSTITSLEFRRYPNSHTKYFILVTTPTRLYQFHGEVSAVLDSPVLQHVFNNYSETLVRYQEIPSKLNYSHLQFYSSSANTVPKSFAWMTGAGVFYGSIDCSGQAGKDSITKDTFLLQYPKDNEDSSNPLSIVLTEFHVLVLFSHRLKCLCVLNEQLVYKDVFVETYGSMLGITRDPMKGTIWAFAEQALYRYLVDHEARNVWQVYLEKGEYHLAKQYCLNDPANMDRVLTKQAEDLFQKKIYKESAELYAETQASFEEITLKFLQTNQTQALKIFLAKKMFGLKSQDKTQLTMIVTWLIELYLNDLGNLSDFHKKKSPEYSLLQTEFHNFLEHPKVKECVQNNRGTIYELMSSHGNEESLIYFTLLMKDYERVIRYHIQHGRYKEALRDLQNQDDLELIYQFSPVLMQAISQQTVDMWISLGRKINPVRVIPALVQYDHNRDSNQGNEAIRYLQFAVHTMDCRDQAIHNYLLSLYVRLQPEKLMAYLIHQGKDISSVRYDLKYALRLCSEYNLNKACVHIYTTMGLYEEAVDLALKEDIELAKQNADMPEDDTELRKKLWLKIACHVVKEKNDIKRAMEFLQECELIKIEDILPFFPDFVTIDNFKDAICASLQEYNQHIEVLKEEMKEATESAKEIRAEIQTFRNKFAVVKGQDKCFICNYPVLTRAFYLFPCQHIFHSDCLVAEVLPHLNPSKRHEVEEIQRRLASYSYHDDSTSNTAASTAISESSSKEQLKAEFDDRVAAECLYCGDIMIKCIDQPFIDPSEYNEEMQGWE